MLEVTSEQIDEAFKSAKNPNAAVKNFLKKDVGNDESAARFAKDFRAVLGRPVQLKSFIEQNIEGYEIYFLAIARHLNPEFYASVIQKIFDAHAEKFNTTYEKEGEGIRITDEENFSNILAKVDVLITNELKGAGLPASDFMKKSVMLCVFEPEVYSEALEVLR